MYACVCVYGRGQDFQVLPRVAGRVSSMSHVLIDETRPSGGYKSQTLYNQHYLSRGNRAEGIIEVKLLTLLFPREGGDEGSPASGSLTSVQSA